MPSLRVGISYPSSCCIIVTTIEKRSKDKSEGGILPSRNPTKNRTRVLSSRVSSVSGTVPLDVYGDWTVGAAVSSASIIASRNAPIRLQKSRLAWKICLLRKFPQSEEQWDSSCAVGGASAVEDSEGEGRIGWRWV